MADKDTLWTAVKAAYDASFLLPITSVNDRTATSIGSAQNTVGTAAAEQLIGLWPHYTEVAFSVTDTGHLAVAIRGTVAILLERASVGSEQAAKEWQEVFGDSGMMRRIKVTGPRGHPTPKSNAPDKTSAGAVKRGWSDTLSLPIGTLPSHRTVNND